MKTDNWLIWWATGLPAALMVIAYWSM